LTNELRDVHDSSSRSGAFLRLDSDADPLSDALEGLECRARMAGVRRLVSPWGIGVPDGHPWFYFFLNGHGVATIAKTAEQIILQGGDLLLVTRSCRHILQDETHSPVVDLDEWIEAGEADERTASARNPNRRKTTTVLWGSLHFDGPRPNALESSLPNFIHILGRAGDPAPEIRPIVRLLADELGKTQLSARTIINRLVQILYARAVRSWVLDGFDGPSQGLGAFLDPKIGHAISLMHRRAGEPWTMDRLASSVHMSRTAFVTQFASKVGLPPGQYLRECRMLRACSLLRKTTAGLDEIAFQIGYESASAFSKAFKRWAGVAPSGYRRIGEGRGPNEDS